MLPTVPLELSNQMRVKQDTQTFPFVFGFLKPALSMKPAVSSCCKHLKGEAELRGQSSQKVIAALGHGWKSDKHIEPNG